MFKPLTIAAALVLGSALAGPVAAQTADKGAGEQFKLAAQNDSGETGTATIKQDGENLMVSVKVSETKVAQPIHIHEGTCAKLDPKPAYPLTTLENGVSETKIPNLTLAKLTAGEYAINVHKSTTEGKTYVACGNLKVAKK